MNARPSHRSPAADPTRQKVQDEWGLFDPNQAGMPAVMRNLPSEGAASSVTRSRGCVFCSEPLATGATQCPRCLREIAGTDGEPSSRPAVAAPAASTPSNGAVYTMESPARCPECEKEIRMFRVLRVIRTQVSFTSTLPRKGYVVVCPECERLLSAELSGLI